MSKTESSLSTIENIRVLIVDDQHFARQFLETVLKLDTEFSNLQVIGTAKNGQEAVEKVALLNPDVVLLDLEMPEMDGISATKIIAEKFPQSKVLVLSSCDNSSYLYNVLQAGAKGYLLKDTPSGEIRNAICSINKGYYQVGPGLLSKALDNQIEVLSRRSTPKPQSSLDEEPDLEKINVDSAKSKQSRFLSTQNKKKLTYGTIASLGVLLSLLGIVKVEQKAIADGKIGLKGKTVEIPAQVDGRVSKLFAQEGQVVKAGTALLSIESEAVASQLQQERQKLATQKNQLAQFESLKQKNLEELDSRKQQNLSAQQEKRAQLDQAQQQEKSFADTANLQKQEKQAQLNHGQKIIQTSQAAYELAKMKVESVKNLISSDNKAQTKQSKSTEIPAEKTQIISQAEQELELTKLELEEAESNLKEIQSGYQTLIKEQNTNGQQVKLRLSEQQSGYNSLLHANGLALLQIEEKIQTIETQLTSLAGEITQQENQVKSLESQLNQYTVSAPVEGTVVGVPNTDSKSTIKSGDTIALMVQMKKSLYPESNLVLRGMISGSDLDTLKPGLPAKIKLDDYPGQNYSTIKGHVSFISSNPYLVKNQKLPSRKEAKKFYGIEITIDQSYFNLKNKQIKIASGLTGKAEIVIGRRRLINHLLNPVQKANRDQ